MGFKFNPLWTSGFSLTGSSSDPNFVNPVATEGDLPTSPTPNDGALIVVQATDHVYVYDTSTSKWVDTGLTTAAFGSSPTANGYTLVKDTSGSIIRNEVVLQPADNTHPGGVSTTTQTFGGNKTFSGSTTTSGILNTDGGIDRSTSGTLTIGATNSTTINIGNSGATVNIQGTTIYENTPQLLTADPLITVNHGGLAGSGQNAGVQIEENSSITGYVETSSDRNSWILKAPNTAGIATLTPGASGITLDQSSHNPVTLAAVGAVPNANGASLSTQQLNLQPADGTNPGVLTAGAQTIGGIKTLSSSPVLSALTASQVVVTDAGKALSSVVYTNANTNSAIVQRDGSGNFSAGTITASLTGNVTGSASLNVLKAGDTMTGPLVMPAGSATTAELNGGTANTGIFFPTSATTAFTSGGAEVSRFTANGQLINTTTADTATALHIKAPSGQTGVIAMESTGGSVYNLTANGNGLALAFGTGTWTPLQFTGTGSMTAISTTNRGAAYKIDFNTTSTNTTQGSITNGTTDWGIVAIRNTDTTVNNMEGIVFTGSSSKPQGEILVTNQVHTSGSETAKMDFRLANSGTVGTGFTINADKSVVLPGYTTAGLLSNDTSGNITSVTNYAVAGDIAQTSFTAADNQSAAANVTGLAFANASVRAAEVILSVTRASTYAFYRLDLIQKGSSWEMSQNYTGDDTGLVFTVTTAGQVQYTSSSVGSTATVKFRARVTSV